MRSKDLIREARLRAGLSQRELAERLGLSQQAVSRWESGRVLPSFETLQEVIGACDLDMAVQLVNADRSYDTLLLQSLARTPQARVEHLLRRRAVKARMRSTVTGSGTGV